MTQVISFYFIAILNTKLSKYDEFEKKQKQFMSEVDDSLAAYLAEVKDENEKLLQKLHISKNENQQSVPLEPVAYSKQEEAKETPTFDFKPPVNIALKSYAQTPTLKQEEENAPQGEIDDRTRAINLRKEGKSVEEIARTLQMGKTEVELILKFN